MISLSVAVSPPLTLLPPRPVPVDVNGLSFEKNCSFNGSKARVEKQAKGSDSDLHVEL
jgi:hypothetical protein